MGRSISKNYIYNTSYQILTLLTPLITTPYLSRVLKADGIGEYSFTTSIVSYFLLLAMLGISNYGQRQIAYEQDNPELRSRTFYEVSLFKVFSVSLSLVTYYLFISMWQPEAARLIYWIQALNIIALFFDVTWFFQGLEEFGKIVFRNLICRILNIILIFICIREPKDLLLYIGIMGGMNILSMILLLPYMPRYLVSVQWNTIRPFRNIRAVLELFLPTVAIQVYTVLDKTMIGLMSGLPAENGYYEQAEKITKMSLMLVTSLGTVMLPRIAHFYAQNDTKKICEAMLRSYRFAWMLGFLLFFGIIGVADHFVPWFFGPGFEKVVPLLCVFSGLLLAIGINNVTGIQYMIPTNQQNLFTLTVTIGAGVNFVLNILWIPYLASIGAAWASVIAETVIALVQFYFVKDMFSFKKVIFMGIPYLIYGGLMYSALYIVGMCIAPSVFSIIFLMFLGIIIYIGLLWICRDALFIMAINKIKERMTRVL